MTEPQTTDEKVEALTRLVEALASSVQTMADNDRKLVALVTSLRERVNDLDRRTIGSLQIGGSY